MNVAKHGVLATPDAPEKDKTLLGAGQYHSFSRINGRELIPNIAQLPAHPSAAPSSSSFHLLLLAHEQLYCNRRKGNAWLLPAPKEETTLLKQRGEATADGANPEHWLLRGERQTESITDTQVEGRPP